MPLFEGDDSLGSNADNWYDVILRDKLENLAEQYDQAGLDDLRNSVVDAPDQPVLPKERNPDEMEHWKIEQAINKEIQAEMADAWEGYRANKNAENYIPLVAGGVLIYYLFF